MFSENHPDWMTKEALDTLGKGYLVPGETPRDMWKRNAVSAEKYLKIRDISEDFMEMFWKGYFGGASPVLSNMGSGRGLPISCYSNHISNSISSIYSHSKESAALSKYGGGVGTYFGDLQPSGSPIKDGGKANTVVDWMRLYDHTASIVSQGGVRRGSFAFYLPIDHPDLLDVLRSKDHTQGDPRKFIDSNIAVTVTDSWVEELLAGDKEKLKIFSEVIKCRLMSGSPYIVYIDNANNQRPDPFKLRNLKIFTSNLCFTGDTLVAVADGRNKVRISELEGQNFPVYSARPRLASNGSPLKQWVPEIKNATAFCTGEREVVEVELEDGSTFRCTPDHQLALRDTTWVEASNSVGKVLEPFTSRVNRSGHREICCETGKSNPRFSGIDNYELIKLGREVFEKLGYFDKNAYLSLKEEGYNIPLSFSNYRFGGSFSKYIKYVFGEEEYNGEYEVVPPMPISQRSSQFDQEDKGVRDIRRNGLRVVSIRPVGVEKVYDLTVEDNHNFYIVTNDKNNMYSGVLVHNCSEIFLPTDENHTFVCVLSSLNLARYDEWKDWKGPVTGKTLPELGIYFLDAVLEEFIHKAERLTSMGRAVRFAKKSRSLGLGVMGLHSLYQSRGLPFSSGEARKLNIEIHSWIDKMTLKASQDMAKEFGEPEWCQGNGVRHATRIAIAPTKTNSVICNAGSEGIEPMIANLFTAENAKGVFVRKNPYLEKNLIAMGKNTKEVWDSILEERGSVQHLDFLPATVKEVFKTAREIDQFEIIKQAADRQPYVCQGQSVNLYVDPEAPAKYLLELHLSAWKAKLKSLYYLKSSSLQTKKNKVVKDYKQPAFIVTTPTCPWCVKAKELLHKNGYVITEKDRSTISDSSWPYTTVPQIWLNGTHVEGGYEGLAKIFSVEDEYEECLACQG
jgi:ribonucleotide reductase alpha subunit